MTGGLMNRTSGYALIAAASLLIGGWNYTAKAADLGGDCCSDLEDRVAELESTTARKGNRKVSLEISGQVDKALLAWNDGTRSDAYIVDNSYSSSRFRMKGTGQMMPGWKAGFYLELEGRDSNSTSANNTSEAARGTDSSTGSLRWRQENVFVESDKFGRVTIGVQNMATKDLVLTNLGGGMSDPENYYANSFKVMSGGKQSSLAWGNLSNAMDAVRAEVVRYDTPSIFGFILSASWGQNDVWDIALRYQKEWNSIRVAAGVGYNYFGEHNCPAGVDAATNNTCSDAAYLSAGQIGTNTKTENVIGNVSVMHVPTGLYATFSAGSRHLTNPAFTGQQFVNNTDANYWYLQSGMTKRFFEPGATTVYGEYADYKNFAIGSDTGFTAASGAGIGRVTASDTTRYGVGFTQAFDGAALELFTNYYHYDTSVTAQTNLTTITTGTTPVTRTSVTGRTNLPTESWDAVLSGMRLKF